MLNKPVPLRLPPVSVQDDSAKRSRPTSQIASSGAEARLDLDPKRMSEPPPDQPLTVPRATFASLPGSGAASPNAPSPVMRHKQPQTPPVATVQLWAVIGEADAATTEASKPRNTCAQAISGALWLGKSDGSVQVWDISSASLVWEIRAHYEGTAVLAIAAVPHRKQVWTVGEDGSMNRFDSETGELLFSEDQQPRICCFELCGTDTLCAACPNGTIRVWQVEELSPAIVIKLEGAHTDVVALCAADGGLVWAADGTQLSLVDVSARKTVRVIAAAHERPIRTIAAVDGGLLWSVGEDRKILVWDMHSGVVPLAVVDTNTTIERAVGLPCGAVMTSAGTAARVWLAEGCRALCNVNQFHTSPIIAIFVVDKTARPPLVASISADDAVAIWAVSLAH